MKGTTQQFIEEKAKLERFVVQALEALEKNHACQVSGIYYNRVTTPEGVARRVTIAIDRTAF